MNYFIILYLIAFRTAPWTIDSESYRLLKSQIESRHQERQIQSRDQGIDYLVDRCEYNLNFPDSDCPYCQNEMPDLGLEEKLKEAGFYKYETQIPQGHCLGISIIFAKHLLQTPFDNWDSCKDIVSKIISDPDFHQIAHQYSANQPYQYLESIASDKTENPLHVNPSAMKKFLHVIMETEPEDYFFLHHSQADASKFDEVAIYSTLKKLPRKILLISYTNRRGINHSIVVSTHPEKILWFDSNQGLYQFADLETLSWVSGQVLQGSELRWIASFPIGQ